MNDNQFTSEDIEKNKDLAALSYVWIFSAIVLLARRDSAFARFHAKQGFVLFLLTLVLWPFEITRYGEYSILPLMVLGFIDAAQGRDYGVPLVSELTGGSRKSGHEFFHGLIRIFRPSHVTPELREKLLRDEQESVKQKEFMDKETDIQDRENRKVSALISRLEADEKEIQHMKEAIHQVEEKVSNKV